MEQGVASGVSESGRGAKQLPRGARGFTGQTFQFVIEPFFMAARVSCLKPVRVNEVSGAVVSSAMHVHAVLGPGLLESAYQACLAHELRKRGFAVACQVGLPVVFDGEKIELGYRIDLVVENVVIVEVKSVEAIHPVHQA